MPVPAFEFTDRAVPIVQMGRSDNRTLGLDRWGTGQWGTARWGGRNWEPIWTDLTCEIHEITTDTGRAGAVDRFTPGTAEIVASNIHGVSKMIWPPLPPPPTPFEFVPQPPISHEENLAAPNATTLVSNGWSFTDDFQRAGPHWAFPPAWAAGGDFPTAALKLVNGGYSPEVYPDAALTAGADSAWQGNGVLQWTRNYSAGEFTYIEVDVEDLLWPTATTDGTPQAVIELFTRVRAGTQECYRLVVTCIPVFAGANTISWRIDRLNAAGTIVDGTDTYTFSTGTGTNGVFPTVRVRFTANLDMSTRVDLHTSFGLHIEGDGWTDSGTPLTGGRVGFGVHYQSGQTDGRHWPPRITGITGTDFEDDLTRPLGAGWVLHPMYARERGAREMIAVDGAMVPTETWSSVSDGGSYQGQAMAQFTTDFTGDQVFEFTIDHTSMPDELPQSYTIINVFCHGNRSNRAAMTALVDYSPTWDDPSVISCRLYQDGPNGERSPLTPVTEISYPAGGVFPEPQTWRFESDLDGAQRLYLDGALVLEATAETPAAGGRVGIWMDWAAGSPPAGESRPTVARIERVLAGLREPLGTEDLGSWVRIGVDHATLGEHWFFRGFVDGIVPTYIPDHADAVRIECIDSLGEAGRAGVIDTWLPHRFAAAPTRIRQLLNAAHWPKNLRQIHDDSTQMSRPAAGKAVDGLTRVAESCGGAVYGDPVSGDIVFKGTDWQGKAASRPPLAVLTNFHTEGDDETVPRVCPVGWELSKRRGDICTRVRLTSETSETEDGEPIVKEWRSPEMEFIYGVELYEATVLAISAERINELAKRQLIVRGARDTPRVEAVLLDAATAEEALDLMTTATFTVPSKYRCSHYAQDAAWAFNTNYLVTGVRHRIRPTQWTCRLALDLSAPFHETGGRWGRALWGRDVWGKTR